jgi:hypothetical protein
VSRRPRVVDQFLHGQPAHALDEAALDLAQVDRRIERAADVVEDVDRGHLVLAGQRVDHHLAQRRAISEIEEGPAAMGGPVVIDVRRRVEAGRGQRDSGEMGAAAEIVEGAGLAARGDAVAGEGDLFGRAAEDRRGEIGQPAANISAASRAAMPLRSAPDEAAVAEVLGTLSVRVAETFTFSIGRPNTSATTWATLTYSPWPISVPPWFRCTSRRHRRGRGRRPG